VESQSVDALTVGFSVCNQQDTALLLSAGRSMMYVRYLFFGATVAISDASQTSSPRTYAFASN